MILNYDDDHLEKVGNGMRCIFFTIFDMGTKEAQCGKGKNFHVANILRKINLVDRPKIDFTQNLDC